MCGLFYLFSDQKCIKNRDFIFFFGNPVIKLGFVLSDRAL